MTHTPLPWRLAVTLLASTVVIAACAHQQHRSPLFKQHPVAISIEATELIQTAKRYLGTRYRFGGNHTKGTDCSGFIQLVFRQHGVRLPHSTLAQAQLGQYVPEIDELAPGDLVFFETYRKGPSHVGIYLGNHRFIHASTGEKKVVITRITSEYYGQRFLGGKRLLTT